MIGSYFHSGSGMGNQLFRFVASKVIAEDKGFEHGMVNPSLFKGASFMNLDMGVLQDEILFTGSVVLKKWFEKEVRDSQGTDIRPYDPEINFVEDNTIIDGEFQDPRYFEHRMGNINHWLKVDVLNLPDDLCVIGFRGGEYKVFPDLFLDITYWDKAISIMQNLNPNMRFEVHTDDPVTAKEFFPEYPVIHDIGINWRSVRYAKYLIIANSSFYILPALLNENVVKVVAPRFWARRSATNPIWALPSNFYRQFDYI